MKYFLLFLACLGSLITLEGCTQGDVVEIATETPVAEVSDTPFSEPTSMPTLLPTNAPTIPPTFTAEVPLLETTIPTILPDTTTVTSTLASSTPLPLTTSTPITNSFLAFLWIPHPVPTDPDPTLTTNLYFAFPGSSPDHWDIQPVLTELYGGPLMAASPDKTKLALLLLEDTNGDRTYIEGDIYKIYLYTLATSQLERIVDNQEFTYIIEWLSDSEGLIYPQDTNIFLVRLDGSPPLQLTNFPFRAEDIAIDDNHITSLSRSPDGMFMAANTYMGDFILIPSSGDEKWLVASDAGNALSFTWSPDSEWLSYRGNYGLGLSLINSRTFRQVEVVEVGTENLVVSNPVWSNDSRLFAFTQGNSELYLWDETKQRTEKLATAVFMSSPVWSPDNSMLAAAFSEESNGGFFIFNTSDWSQNEWSQPVKMETARMLTWSPDGRWIAFFGIRDDIAGLYLLNTEDGNISLIMETTGLTDPASLVWLPENNNSD